MRFLLLVCWDAEKMDAQTEPEPNTTEPESFPWLDDLQARGIWVTGDQVAPPRRARSVRVRGGKTMVTDGPFAETKEVVGGFDIIDCGSLEDRRDRGRAPERPDGNDRGAAVLGARLGRSPFKARVGSKPARGVPWRPILYLHSRKPPGRCLARVASVLSLGLILANRLPRQLTRRIVFAFAVRTLFAFASCSART